MIRLKCGLVDLSKFEIKLYNPERILKILRENDLDSF